MWELIIRKMIIKEEEPQLYAYIKTKLQKKNSRYMNIFKKLGWYPVIAQDRIYLRTPQKVRQRNQAVKSFKDTKDYLMLSAIYYYLGTTAAENVFTAEDIIEDINIICGKTDIRVDMNAASSKYSLYRALMYCEKKEYIMRLDGDAMYLIGEEGDGVLYKNTGYAQDRRIMEDCEESMENRIYRSLLTEPVFYYEEENEKEREYIMEYADQIEDDFRYLLHMDVNLVFQDKMSCLLFPQNEITFPKNNQADQFLTRTITFLRRKMEIEKKTDLTEEEFTQVICDVRSSDKEFWTKEYQTMSDLQLVKTAKKGLLEWKAIQERDNVIKIMPLTSAIQGEIRCITT